MTGGTPKPCVCEPEKRLPWAPLPLPFALMSSVQEIEEAIERLDVIQQVQLLRDLPARLKITADDVAALRNAESAFGFWDNADDAAYDSL